jgi:hypothetical protein
MVICGVLIGAAMGCQSTKKEPEAQMATPDKVAALRESIQKAQPGAQVGQVIAVIPGYASISDLPVQEIKEGQTITFVDIQGNPINNGTVGMVVGDAVHVKVDKAGKRAPQKGDLAVWLKS